MFFSCPICSDNLSRAPADPTNKDGGKISCAPCGHIFHCFCINKWLEGTMATSSQCPCCRKAIRGKKCLPLFPNMLDDSLAEDPEDSNCTHGPFIEELKAKVDNLEKTLREKLVVLQKLTEDYRSCSNDLRLERERSENFLIKYKEAESYKTWSSELEKRNQMLENELSTMKKYRNLVESIREGKELESFHYPPTVESINTLKTMIATLNRELMAGHNKHKSIQERVRHECAKNEDARREIEKLNTENERLKDQVENLKLDVEQLHQENLNEARVATPYETPKRKRMTPSEDSIIILSSPDIDQDIPVLQPLHKRKNAKTTNVSQSSSSSATHPEHSQVTTKKMKKKNLASSPDVDDNDFLYSGLNGGNKMRNDFLHRPGPSTSKHTKNAKSSLELSDASLTPQGFTENLKSSLPGLSRTPSGTFLKSKAIPKNLIPRPPKVLKKK